MDPDGPAHPKPSALALFFPNKQTFEPTDSHGPGTQLPLPLESHLTRSALVKHPRFRWDQPPVFPNLWENALIPRCQAAGDDGISEAGPWDGESVSECLAAFSQFFNCFRENVLSEWGHLWVRFGTLRTSLEPCSARFFSGRL